MKDLNNRSNTVAATNIAAAISNAMNTNDKTEKDDHGAVILRRMNSRMNTKSGDNPTNNDEADSASNPNKWELRKSMRPTIPTQIDEVNKKWLLSSYRCDLSALKKLVQEDFALINTRDFATGFAAIHWAAKMGRNDVIAWLNENNADMNIRTYGGYSPLHIATIHNNKDVVNQLITTFNADVNVRDYSGRKPGFYLLQPSQPTTSNPTFVGPSGRHLFTASPNVRCSISNSLTMPNIADQLQNTNAMSKKKKKKGISLSNSFKGKRKFLVVKRGDGEGVTEEENGCASPSTGRKIRWRKSLSVPDITVSEPVVVFQQEL